MGFPETDRAEISYRLTNIGEYDSVELRVTFRNEIGSTLTFPDDTNFQLWSIPDAHDFVWEDEVTVIVLCPPQASSSTLGPVVITMLSSEATWIP
ncbi:MAG: hypothetical protein GY835_17930 [bacterium]|nr:hypothetical protein [bacterium]